MPAGKWNARLTQGQTYRRIIEIKNDDEVVADPTALPPVVGVPATPVDLTGYTARWTLWNAETEETVHTASTSPEVIIDPLVGKITLELDPPVTTDLPLGGRLRHQLDIILGGDVTPVLRGRLFVDQGYA